MSMTVATETSRAVQHGGPKSFKDLLSDEKMKAAIAAVLPKHLTPERIVKVAIGATMRTPLLLKCTPQSFIMAVMQAAELGLEPGSALGHAYLVPFFNGQTGVYECQMIPGYRGLIALARRSGEIVSIEAHVVRTKDQFRVGYGLNPTLEHAPTLDGDAGELRFVYAVAKLKDGGVQFEVMSKAQVEAIRMRSQTGRKNKGPWNTDYEEMARKTVVRRLFKYLPVSIELASALELHAKTEGDVDGADLDGVVDMEQLAADAEAADRTENAPAEIAAPSRTESVKEKLAARGESKAAPVAAATAAPAPAAENAAAAAPPLSEKAQSLALDIRDAQHPGALAAARKKVDAAKGLAPAELEYLRKQIDDADAVFKRNEREPGGEG